MERYIIVAYQKNGVLEKEITLSKYYGSVDEKKVLSFNSLGDKATVYSTYKDALVDINKYIKILKSIHTQDQFILWGRNTELEVKRLSEAPTTTKQIKIVKQSNVFDSTLEEDVNQALIDLKDKSVVDIKIIEETEFASAYAVIVYKTDVYEIENSKTQSLAGRDYKEEL